MKIITPNYIHLNSIIIQPTFHCANDCTGCYVKKHARWGGTFGAGTMEHVDNLLDLIQRILLHKNIGTSQIAISLDRLPEQGRQKEQMVKFFRRLVFLAGSIPHEGTKITLTTSEILDFKEYTHEIDYRMADCASLFDMISFSRLFEPGRYFSQIKTLKGSNHIRGYLSTFQAQTMDHIYMLLPKESLGNELPQDNLAAYFDRCTHAKYLIEQDKVHFDTCVEDSERLNATGYGCDAGINRVTVWPTGTVTGCPYANKIHYGKPTPAGTTDEIIERIRWYVTAGINEHKMHCKIPQALIAWKAQSQESLEKPF